MRPGLDPHERERGLATAGIQGDATDREDRQMAQLRGELPYIEGYRILGRLGEGGMGVVYRAEHLALRRLVALKMIRSGSLASADELMRFRIEAEAVARLQHPNIVQVFDFGEQQGLRYLSLEYLEGGSLAGRIAGRVCSPREAAGTIELLARAVHAAHIRGIIHRDLKPHNVLLAADGTPKISDFGLAKLVSDTDLGSSCMMVGTAGYMAPEQAWGSGPAAEIGPAADIYGLGVILYEMLTGRLPFHGNTPRDTLEQVWTKEPPCPRGFQPSVPIDLETICLKCLQKLPHHRYASAEALADDLARFLADEPIAARPVGRLERLVKWARRRPAVAGLVGVSSAASVALLSITVWYQVQVNTNYRLAKANLQQAQNAVDQLISRVSIEGLAPVPRSENLRRELLETALDLCLKLQAKNPTDADLARQTHRAQRQMADLYQLLGQPERARENYQRAIAAHESALQRKQQSPDLRELAVAHNNLANLLARQGEAAGAEQAYQQSIDLWKRLISSDANNVDSRRGLAAAQNNLALSLAARGRLDEAQELERGALAARELLAEQRPQDGDIALELASSRNNLGTILRSLGRYDEAEALLREAAGAMEQGRARYETPAGQFVRASIENNLAAVLAARNKPSEAESIYRTARERFEQLARDFPQIEIHRQGLADACLNLALLLIEQGQLDEAEANLTRAGEIYGTLLEESPRAQLGLLSVRARQSQLLAKRGEFGEAEKIAIQATELGQRLVQQAPHDSDAECALALAFQSLGNTLPDPRFRAQARHALLQAVEHGRRAVELSPSAHAPRFVLAESCAALARLLLAVGDVSEASRLAEELVKLLPDQPDQTLEGVHLLAQCIPLASGIKGRGAEALRDGVPLDEHCARRAAELLWALKAQGMDLSAIFDQPGMESLKQRPEVQGLLGQP
jgi:tetratricopeptide (TPR) repeat protein/tRNA A-37 threonylcarbamoyl transferase component Bud32